jgi:two-component system cell cycle sensor histidine kinase/response regulator CckA
MDALVAVRDPQARGALAAALSARGHAVRIADPEEIAAEGGDQPSPFFVALDCRIGHGGAQAEALCRRLRARPRGAQAFILAVADPGALDEVDALLEAGASDFIERGASPSHVERRIRVAELRVVEAAARSSGRIESAAQTYLNLAEVVFVGIAPDERVILVNRKACELLGYSEAELIGKRWFDELVPERERADVKRVFQRLMAGEVGPVEHYENAVLTKSGEERIIAWHNALLRSPAGEITASLSSGEDITARKRAEDARRRSEEILSATLHSIGDAVIATDVEGRVTLMNAVAERLTGYSLAEARGRPLDDIFRIVHEETRRPVESPVTLVLQKGGVVGLANHTTLIAKDGTERPIADSGAPIRSAQGELHGVVLVFRDMSEEREAELALQRSESRLRSFYESAPFMMGILEVWGDDAVIVSCNPNAAALYGKTVPEVVGRRASELGAPFAGRRLVAEQIQEAHAQQRTMRFRYPRESATGLRVLHVTVAPLPSSPGGQPMVSYIMEDVTDIEEMQARLMLSDRMASLGTLAAGVAHEINNPLAYVATNLDLLQSQGAARAAGDDLALAVAQAREGVERVQQIVKGLRMFSRGDDDKREPLKVTGVIESAIKMAWNEIRHRAEIERDFGDPPRVIANEARLGQLFLNLLVNAAHAIPEGHAGENKIRVMTRFAPPDRVIIEVSDTGVGIAKDVLQHIFDPFFTTRPVGGGMGMGLSICHGIVKVLGGEITVESEVSKGSTFRVSLPAALDASRSSAPPPEPLSAPRRGRVLIVDDEPLLRMSLRALLGSDHDVTTATSAREVLDRIAKGERFDVLLCDLMMPEMTGMDLHDHLSEAAPDQAMRMVFLTGGVFTTRAQAFLERVPNLCLEKPFSIDGLRGVIQRLLR